MFAKNPLRAAKMYAVRCCFLFIMICLKSSSCAFINIKVIKTTAARGNDITTPCTTAKKPQDGVYMYRQQGESKPREVFYFYKEGNLSYKQMKKSKVIVSGAFPNLNVTILNVTATDTGLYWCEFNLEDKITVGSFTWIWTENQDVEQNKETDKECPDEDIPYTKMVLFVCILMFLLCSFGVFFVLLKLKWCRGRKKFNLNPPLDSVYEEMKRSNLDTQPTARTFINPEYQSSKQLQYP